MSQETGPHSSSKGILNGFVEKSILLTGLYFFIGNVFQQTYLRTIGIRSGMIDSNQIIPNFTNPIIVAYAFSLWIILSRLPERWYKRLAELANPATWRDWANSAFRLLGIFITYSIFNGLNLLHIYKMGYFASSTSEYIIPAADYLTRPYTLELCVIYGIILMVIYFIYTSIRRKQLTQVLGKNRRFMSVALHGIAPAASIYLAITVAFILPANYAVLKAKTDINRMRVTEQAKVVELVLREQSCIPTQKLSSSYIYKSDLQKKKVHYLGIYSDIDAFIIYPLNQNENNYDICLVQTSIIQSLQLSLR